MVKPDLLPKKNNYDELLRGFLETPGRIPQPSYNFYVILSQKISYYVNLNLINCYTP